MAYFKRIPEKCPHRSSVNHSAVGFEAKCGLIHKIFDANEVGGDSEQDVVSQAVCESCCSWFEPTVVDWNPIVATLLFNRLEGTPKSSGTQKLKDAAIAKIPIQSSEVNVYLPLEIAPSNSVSVQAIENVLPLPAKAVFHSAPFRWMVGITTAPRMRTTISYCIDSLKRSGWTNAYIFADGVVENCLRSESDGLTWITREKSVGGWSNFVLAAQELLHRDPDADAYLMLQDDALIARYTSLREYLERLMTIIGTRSIASLYCCELDTKSVQGWHRSTLPYLRGAQAIVFGREAMRALVSNAVTRPWEGVWHHQSARPLEQRGIDGNVGRWALHALVPVWLPSPSLVWHLGDTSTLWPGAEMSGIRRAGDFLERHLSPSN